MRGAWLFAWGLVALLVLVCLAVWQGDGYVSFSEGVYAASARLVLHGGVPYRDFAASQPPGVYYLGAGLLALGGSPAGMRDLLAVVDLVLGVLVLAAVWRLTRSRLAAMVAGLLALLTPWAVAYHAQLLPETFAAPLLMGAMLAASRERGAALAGVLAGSTLFFKVAFLLPALGIVVSAVAPWRAARYALGTVAAGGALVFAAFGGSVWDNAFVAQSQSGTAPLHYVAGLWAQAAWNLAPLAAFALVGIARRDRGHDPPLLRAVAAGAATSTALALSLLKSGSYLNVMSVCEPPVLVLAMCGISWARSTGAHRLAVLSSVWLAAQVASFLVAPADPVLFGRPGAASPPGWALPRAALARELGLARACRPSLAYSGWPYVAFLADRHLPGNQPDVFIVYHARVDARFRRQAISDRPTCP